MIELKNSRTSIANGIRQNLSNQSPEFNAWFFSTVQFVFSGNYSEGLRYGTIGTPEKYFLKWKEDEADNSRFKLDKYLLKMCAKARLIEMHDFVLFDGGVKKLPRVHQYFGIKAAQQRVNARKGGILGVRMNGLFVQRMRTRWGSCNPAAGTIRLNADLAKKPRECLEYILVHELAHLLEPTHNARFVALMDRFLPDWVHRRELLNRLPVRHEAWGC